MNINIEINSELMSLLYNSNKEVYDCALMLSGGKDSSFLLYLLTKIYNLKVLALHVDHGYGYEDISAEAIRITQNLGVDLKIIRPNAYFFGKLYNSFFLEKHLYKNASTNNYICEICTVLIWSICMKETKQLGIKTLISGLSPEQIKIVSNNSYPPATRNKMNEKMMLLALRNNLRLIEKSIHFKQDEKFRELLTIMKESIEKVTTLYPFLFIGYDELEIKEIISSKFNWTPFFDQNINSYVSIGCKIRSLIAYLEPLNIINTKERPDFMELIKNGYLIKTQDIENNRIETIDEIFDDIGIKDFIEKEKRSCSCLDLCKQNITYVDNTR